METIGKDDKKAIIAKMIMKITQDNKLSAPGFQIFITGKNIKYFKDTFNNLLNDFPMVVITKDYGNIEKQEKRNNWDIILYFPDYSEIGEMLKDTSIPVFLNNRTSVICILEEYDRTIFRSLMQKGVFDCLFAPFEYEELKKTIVRGMQKVEILIAKTTSSCTVAEQH